MGLALQGPDRWCDLPPLGIEGRKLAFGCCESALSCLGGNWLLVKPSGVRCGWVPRGGV